jgi:integron integrase
MSPDCGLFLIPGLQNERFGLGCESASKSAMNAVVKPRLLEQVRASIRLRHYSPRTEEAYIGWIRRFIIFHGKRHPSEMGAAEANAFLTDLAVARKVSASTQTQALCALMFLYREVLREKADWIEVAVSARRPKRLPVVLCRDEVRAVLEEMQGVPRLCATILYGAGLRLLECLELRVKDIDFSRGEILVRDGKGQKDRVTALPAGAKNALLTHLESVRRLHGRDLAEGAGAVALPDALARKYPNAAREWGWQWVFPASSRYIDREAHVQRRHHVHESVIQKAMKGSRPAREDFQTGDMPQPSPQLRDSFVGVGLRYPDRAGTPRASRCANNHDLLPRVESRRPRRRQPLRRSLKPAA